MAAAPITEGLRVFTCGHSFHVWVAPMIADLAVKAGIQNHRVAGVSSIGGSRVIQHWDVAEEKNTAKKALTAGEVDVLTLSPIWLPDAGIENFARLAVEHNPNVRITVQEFWLPNDTFNPVYPLETRKKVDHNAATVPELTKQNDLYRETIETHVRDVNQKLKTSASSSSSGWPGVDCLSRKNHRPAGAAVESPMEPVHRRLGPPVAAP